MFREEQVCGDGDFIIPWRWDWDWDVMWNLLFLRYQYLIIWYDATPTNFSSCCVFFGVENLYVLNVMWGHIVSDLLDWVCCFLRHRYYWVKDLRSGHTSMCALIVSIAVYWAIVFWVICWTWRHPSHFKGKLGFGFVYQTNSISIGKLSALLESY